MTITPAKLRNAHVVYTVVVPSVDTQRPFYIGCCHIRRLCDMPDAQGYEEWRKHVGSTTPIRIHVLGIWTTLAEAERAQAAAIGAIKPWANTHPILAKELTT